MKLPAEPSPMLLKLSTEGEVFVPERDALTDSGPMIDGARVQADACHAGRIMMDHREQSVSGLLKLDHFIHFPGDMNRFSEACRVKGEVLRDDGMCCAVGGQR